MKKIIVLLSMIILLSGCSIIKIDNQSIDVIIDTVLRSDNELCNTVFEGYKYYLPNGFSIAQKMDYNAKLVHEKQNYYLYVDVISYYHKKMATYENNNNAYYFKQLNYKYQGYIQIDEVEDMYFVQVMYNYAKIETYTTKDNLNNTLVLSGQILSSVKFNDSVLDTLVGENVLSYEEETFSILKPKTDSKNFLDYDEEYNVYYDKENELPDEDKIITETEE